MIEIGFVFILWSVKGNHKAKKELDDRGTQHTKEGRRGVRVCQAQLICSEGIKASMEPSLAVT